MSSISHHSHFKYAPYSFHSLFGYASHKTVEQILQHSCRCIRQPSKFLSSMKEFSSSSIYQFLSARNYLSCSHLHSQFLSPTTYNFFPSHNQSDMKALFWEWIKKFLAELVQPKCFTRYIYINSWPVEAEQLQFCPVPVLRWMTSQYCDNCHNPETLNTKGCFNEAEASYCQAQHHKSSWH